ncbi:DUF6732 family protein [uncultured Hoeflea sp.]|uniref:DUF6732 family protein n=1 Tax=uncultured Hoeflea sp. TaxID=538666 RepID=UPI0026220A26|nr:DUF6732 family protein [uncultured Hoeflea sp.]
MRILVFTSVVLTLMGVSTAFAHGGHVGDLAGHSHWVGWAAAAAAAALAAWAAKRGSKAKAKREDDGKTAEAENRPEQAEA